MLSDGELKELQRIVKRIDHKLDEVKNQSDILDDLVRGDNDRNINGLQRDMLLVEQFIDKWEKREYMVRGAFLLVSSNIVLTILAIAASFLGG